MLKFRTLIFVILILFSLILGHQQLHAGNDNSFVVIVNKSNNVSSLSKSQVSRMFLKKTFTWGSGESVKPIDQAPGSEIRETFSDEIHGKSVYSVKNYWQQMIFAGRDVPPIEKKTDQEIIDYVRSNGNAIGYVSRDVDLSSVKVVNVNY